MNLLIVFALSLELEPTAARLRLPEEGGGDFQWLYRGEIAGHTVTAAATGLGREQAHEVTRELAERFRPDLMLFSGFAGALVANFEVGDLVRPDQVLLWDGADIDELNGSSLELPALGVTADAETIRAIERAAGSIRARVDRRPLVTVDVVVREPGAKRALGRASGAAAVDMESAAGVSCAAELGVPCAVVRAISDDVDDRVPEELGQVVGTDGRPNPEAIARLAEYPGLLAVLRRLSQNGNTARHRLAELYEAYLTA